MRGALASATFASASMANHGSDMLAKRTWAVVGNHGKNPVVDQLTERLRQNDKLVYRVNPYGRPPAEYKSLADIPDARAIECIDLVVNPKMGVDVLRECDTLGIANVWIQPGAGDADLLAEAKKLGIHAHEGCVLVELPPNPAAGL